jgi:LCP family protein required for cell wall assembly
MAPVTFPEATRPGRAVGPDDAAARAARRDSELSRVRFRRAWVLLLMTLVLPGSAQLVMGEKRVGRIAIRIFLGCVGALLCTVLLGLVSTSFVFWLGANTFFLGLLRVGLVVLAIGWALLFIDAWRLGEPLRLAQRQRLFMVGANGVMVFVVAGSLLFASHIVAVQRGFISALFGDGVVSGAEHGRYNVLLVGGDSGAGRWGLRTDSMTIASIDEDTGRTVLFGLPRNMTNFPFPEGSLMHKQFPHGYDCTSCELNSLATWAGDHRALFKHSEDPGMDATIQGIEGITGLKINYYAMVDLAGFRGLVSAMGGLTLNVRDDIPIGGGEQGQIGTIPAGVHKLNGYQVLWFARSRMAADDYSRMARQKCVMNAMLQQLSPQTVITKFEGLAKASEALLETNLPASELGTFAELALKARSQPISSVSFVPPAINTADPDIDKIRSMIGKAIDRSENVGSGAGKAAAKKKSKGFSANQGGASTGGSIGSMADGYAANKAQDLSKAC